MGIYQQSFLIIFHFVNTHRLPDIRTATMKDWKEKLEKITNQSLNKNITNLSGVPSWMLLLLKNVLKKTKANNILEVWPNLELYIHGGINFSPYKINSSSIIPSKKMNYLKLIMLQKDFLEYKIKLILMICY